MTAWRTTSSTASTPTRRAGPRTWCSATTRSRATTPGTGRPGDPGCGCTGGGKFWAVNGAIVTDNWIHGNHSEGLWADTDNRGFDIQGNYIADNYDVGLIYEISYNARIVDNVFIRNGVGGGPQEQWLPDQRHLHLGVRLRQPGAWALRPHLRHLG